VCRYVATLGDPASVETFRESVKRCLARTEFMKDFYDFFLASSDEVREKFRNTDLEKQRQMVADSLYLMAVAGQSPGREGSIAWAEMSRLAQRHAQSNRDIRPALYDLWLDCLLRAVRQHDPEYSPAVEAAWRDTLRPGIEFMQQRYGSG
jgi:hemoglobin-like flavoprotein